MVINILATLTSAPGKSTHITKFLTLLDAHYSRSGPNTLRYVCSRVVGTGTTGSDAVGDVNFTVIEQYTGYANCSTHSEAEWHGFVGKALASEGLLAKPLEILRVEKIAGFEGR